MIYLSSDRTDFISSDAFAGCGNEVREDLNREYHAPTAQELSDGERQIMGDVLCGTYIDASEVNGLYLDVLDSVIGTKEERQTLSDRIKAMTAGERLKLIESVI